MTFIFDEDLSKVERDGVWVDYKGSEFLIAHANNLKFQKEFARLQAPYHKKIMKGRLDPDVALEIMCKSLSHAVLIGWKNVKDSNGKDVEFNEQNAFIALKKNGAFREFVQEVATDYDQYVKEDKEQMGESSASSSTGT